MKLPTGTVLHLLPDSNAFKVLGPTAKVHRDNKTRDDDDYTGVAVPGKEEFGYCLIMDEDVRR